MVYLQIEIPQSTKLGHSAASITLTRSTESRKIELTRDGHPLSLIRFTLIVYS